MYTLYMYIYCTVYVYFVCECTLGLSDSIDNAIYRDSTRTIAITIIDFLLSLVTTWCMRMITHVGCAHALKILPCELVLC